MYKVFAEIQLISIHRKISRAKCPAYSLRSHLTNTRSGDSQDKQKGIVRKEFIKRNAGAADLLPGHVVVPRLKPAAGIRPASRLVASQNLWPRHLLLFYEMTSK